MKTLAATALFACTNAAEETSLMQNLVTRSSSHGQLDVRGGASASKQARADNTDRLLETATKMIKNGVTPDVVSFVDSTVAEINEEVLPAIQSEHDSDQQFVNDELAEFDTCLETLTEAEGGLSGLEGGFNEDLSGHQYCRSEESVICAKSRRCETQLITLWEHVRREEIIMREIHDSIHEEWCVAPPASPAIDQCTGCTEPNLCGVTLPDHVLSRCFDWSDMSPYPILNFPEEVKQFRRFSVTEFTRYIEQKRVVEEYWRLYNLKLTECSTWEVRLDDKVIECDEMENTLNHDGCTFSSSARSHRQTFGQCWSRAEADYDLIARVGTTPSELPCTHRLVDTAEGVAHDTEVLDADSARILAQAEREVHDSCDWGTIRQLEYDRKREWETLKIVQCLLQHVHSAVETSLETGAPCPTIDSDPDGTRLAIEDCHVVTESLTEHLTIIYGDPPPVPPLPPVPPPPCSPAYLASEQTFLTVIATSFRATIEGDTEYPEDPLTDYITSTDELLVNSWPGCAAPIVCQTCAEFNPVPIDPSRTEPSAPCLEHQKYLALGASDVDTFRCLGSWCLDMAGRCNGHAQCGDGSDEEGCFDVDNTPANLGQAFECPADMSADVLFRCTDNTCITRDGLCNDYNNCADGSDEATCSPDVTIQDPTDEQELAYLGCFEDGNPRDMGPMVGTTNNAATNTFDLCRAACAGYSFMSLQYGGECFCSNSYGNSNGNGGVYGLRPDSECNRMISPCSDHSYNCGGTWRQAIYRIGAAIPAVENQCAGTYEAEDATIHGGVEHANVASAGHQGFTGRSFVDYLNPTGDFVEWTVESCSGGSATASFRYALGGGNRPLRVLVNNVEVESSLSFPATGSWNSWSEASFTVQLGAGTNVVRLVAIGSSGANMDSLIIRPAAGAAQFHHGASGSNSCGDSVSASESECLAAVQGLLRSGEVQVRTGLVTGSWGWVPPGCSVQADFTHGRAGDFAAHYNGNGNGNNDGGYTPVCFGIQSGAASFLQTGSQTVPATRTRIRTSIQAQSTSGRTISVVTPQVGGNTFHDRGYTFTNLGGLRGMSQVMYSNEDKVTDFSHIMTQIRIDEPMTVYIVKLEEKSLPWLDSEGYTQQTRMEGVSFSGTHTTPFGWSSPVTVDAFEASRVYSRTFKAGTVSIPGNNGGAGGFLMFLAPA